MNEIGEETVFIPQVSNTNQIHRKFHNNQHLKEFILWFILLICLLLLAGPFTHHLSYSVPTVKTRTSARHVFISNTRGNFDARDYLILQIKRICSPNKRHIQCELNLQNFTDSQHNQLQNIFVRILNTLNKSRNIPSVMLTAHYDSVEFSPGAGDDGSGLVIILELLSNLINDLTINFSNVHLVILFTNAEESELQGALAFITDHRWRFNIRHFFSIDSISCNDVADLLQTTSSQLIIDYSQVARLRTNVILQKIPKWIPFSSDYDVFILNNSRFGYDFGFLPDGYTYHTSSDHISTCKQGIIQDLGDTLAILIRNILLENNQQLNNMNDTDPLIYFDILGRYLMIYKLSTSVLIQKILIVFIIIIGIIRIIFDHIYRRQQNFSCNDFHCIYFRFKNPLTIRILSIIIYSISNILSMIIGVVFSLILACIVSMIQPVSCYGWFSTGNMSHGRYIHTASVLSNGNVLVAGGESIGDIALNSAELYDSSTGASTPTGNMTNARYAHTASVLSNGKVLVTGGTIDRIIAINSTELYDPSTGTWAPTISMMNARAAHTASVLSNGKVLVTGGQTNDTSFLNSAELYDPSTGTWTITDSMTYTRSTHTASILSNGTVLVTGGIGNGNIIFNTAELYDPSTGAWTTTSNMADARYYPMAAVLSNGKVLVTGGFNGIIALSSTELY
ncbi:unnamed protein product [Adineta steineri]|uniref:Peptidase M28 domain-containing protein n=1 Tax=Adineta steineri TaxID=433720 RepID=A0A814SWC2_9BILA|nr:unnamed protein product [Adineta steineri]CAF1462776.1 unnamed protein product [Adineta steineri]